MNNYNKSNSMRVSSKKRNGSIPFVCVIVSGFLVAVIMIASSILFSSSSTYSAGSSANPFTIGTQSADLEVLSSYTATSENGDTSRYDNIALAAEAINGVNVAAGNQFSFNNAIGDISKDTRYKTETSATDGSTPTTQYSGVSQVSSALYIAALEAGLDVTERHPNTIAQDYVPLGLDATVSYGDLDLVFCNATRNPVVIEATQTNGSVTVTIYGTPPSTGETYKASSTLIDKVESTSGDTSTTQYIVNTFRLMYKDGACIQRDLLYTDVYYGSVSPDPQARNILI